MNKNNPVQQFI